MDKGNAQGIDLHVGNAIRVRRNELKLSQGDLANAAGITFQQVQKYERGANRVSAPVLYAFARRLGVSPNFFFDGLEGVSEGETDASAREARDALRSMLSAHGGLDVVRAFVNNPHARKAFTEVARALKETAG